MSNIASENHPIMKAAIYEKYGPPEVLQIKQVPKPAPQDNQILIKIHATSVSSGDVKMRSFSDIPPLPWLPFRLITGLFKPRKKILGFTIAGKIEAIGSNIKKFKVGDRVFGSTGFGSGSYSEYVCLPESAVLTKMSSKMKYEQAAAIPFGAMTSLYFLKKANIKKGQSVLIYGSSGALGTYAIQLAKYYGAVVTGVCSGKNTKLVKSLEADETLDYTKGDVFASNQRYDVIFDTVGKSNFSKAINSLNKSGYYLRAVHLELSPILKGLLSQITSDKKVIGGVASEKVEDLIFLKKLFDQGKLKPVIDKTYSLEKIAKAHEYVESGHKKGNVVIAI